jgi:hypothetical protein
LWGKKDKHCNPLDPADDEQGSYWDHAIIDPESKLIISLVVGQRTADTVVQVFTDFFDRTDGALPQLITTDEYAVYQPVILDTFGVWWREEMELTPEEIKEFEHVQMSEFHFPVEISYARVHKERKGGRVVEVTGEVILGSAEQAQEVVWEAGAAQTINTSFIERWFGTQRQFNARKRRKSYTFSKELSYHEACTWLVVLWYNFGWCVRTLREKLRRRPPRYRQRTPAMAAGLSDHVWSMEELLRHPLYPQKDDQSEKRSRTYQDVLERLKGVYPAPSAA